MFQINLRKSSVVENQIINKKINSPVNDELIINLGKSGTKSFNGSDFEEAIYATDSDKSDVLVTFLTSSSKESTKGKNFELIFTTYSSTDSNDQCVGDKNWFNCGDQRCVRQNLVCDYINNCVSSEDESDHECGKWYASHKQLFWAFFITGWAISTFFIILTLILCVTCRKKVFTFCL